MSPESMIDAKALSRRHLITNSTLTLGGVTLGGITGLYAGMNTAETSNFSSITITESIFQPKYHSCLNKVNNYRLGAAMDGREPWAPWLKADDDFEVPYLSNVNPVLLGGSTNVRLSVSETTYQGSVRVDD